MTETKPITDPAQASPEAPAVQSQPEASEVQTPPEAPGAPAPESPPEPGKKRRGRKKKKTKMLVDKATLLIMTESNPIRKVDLEGDFGLFKTINRENIIKTILLPQLE